MAEVKDKKLEIHIGKGGDILGPEPLEQDKNGIIKIVKQNVGKFSDETAAKLIESIGEGKSYIEICDAVGIRRGTLFHWKTEGYPEYNKEFAKLFKEAEKGSASYIVAECKAIADDDTGDVYTDQGKLGPVERPNNANVQRSKLRIDTRMRMAAFRDKSKYGKTDVVNDNSSQDTTFIIQYYGDKKKPEGAKEGLPHNRISTEN